MKLKIEERAQARELRVQGLSYREIQSILPSVKKSTLSGWIKDIPLSPEQENRLIEKMRAAGLHGRQAGALKNKLRAKERFEKSSQEAHQEFQNLKSNPLFITGASLYKAEGSKTSRMFQFINSDPQVIQVMIRWLELVGAPANSIRARLFIHEVYANENCEEYWRMVTNLPINQFRKTCFKPTPHKVKRNPTYKGCCRIECLGVEFFWKVTVWQDLLFNSLLYSW